MTQLDQREMQTPPARPATSHAPSILIRPFQLADATPMHEAAHETMEQLCNWMTWCRPDYSVADARTFIEQCAQAQTKGEHHSFAIVDSQNGDFLGSAGLNQLCPIHKFANVGCWVRSSAAGRGVATIALRFVIDYAFAQLELQRLEFLMAVDNVASQRLAQKAGAKFEGILRNRLLIAGRSHDGAMYSLVRSEYPGI